MLAADRIRPETPYQRPQVGHSLLLFGDGYLRVRRPHSYKPVGAQFPPTLLAISCVPESQMECAPFLGIPVEPLGECPSADRRDVSNCIRIVRKRSLHACQFSPC